MKKVFLTTTILIGIFLSNSAYSATVTKTIGTNGRDYSTITLWEADLDNTIMYLRPDSDVALGNWKDNADGTTNIYQAIDETTASDTDYIKSGNDPGATADIYTASVSDPASAVGRGYQLNVRYRKVGTDVANIVIKIYESTTEKKSVTYNGISTSWVTRNLDITDVTMTNWNNARIEFRATTTVSAGNTRVEVSWSEVVLVSTDNYAPGDNAVGEVYNDSVFNESVTINGGGMVGLASITLTVPEGERHDGTAGTGVKVIITSTDGRVKVAKSNTTVEWIEIDANHYSTYSGALTLSAGATGIVTARNMIVHNGERGNFSSSVGVSLGEGPFRLLDTIVYDFKFVGDTGHPVYGIAQISSLYSPAYVYNVTVHAIKNTNASSAGSICGFWIYDSANLTMRNLLITDSQVAGSGTAMDYSISSLSNAIASHNLSSDATASYSTGNEGTVLTNKSSANQFVSTVGGSEDLHLKAGADAIDAGTDLGTTPTGVNFDIDNRDRDALGDVWDIGADEYVAPPVTETLKGVKLKGLEVK